MVYYRIPGCDSTFQPHARKLTEALAEILKLGYHTEILREPTLKEHGLRPDALIYITKGGQHLCFILEVCLDEKPEYLLMKFHAWQSWPEAEIKLSELFNTRILVYDFVVAGEEVPEGAFEFNQYLENIKEVIR